MKQAACLEEIYSPIEKRLSRIPEAIFEILSTPNELAREAIRHFFSVPGKYLRPALTFLGALVEKGDDLSAAREEKLVRLAGSYEIFHSATLVHDDIIDSAHLRRNIETLNTKWNPQVAVLVGDYLHDKAIGAIFSIENPPVISLFIRTAGLVCQGEIHELQEKNNFNLKEEEYFEIIREKTASLIACCLAGGGMLAGLSAEKVEALKRFGWAFGAAFQIVDDCLDFTGEEHEFGKTLGVDFEGGVLTLPLIRLIGLVDETAKGEVFKIFKRGSAALPDSQTCAVLEDVSDFRSERFATLRNLLREYGALDYAMARAQEFTDRARLELSIFPDSSVRRSLERLLDYVLERNR